MVCASSLNSFKQHSQKLYHDGSFHRLLQSVWPKRLSQFTPGEASSGKLSGKLKQLTNTGLTYQECLQQRGCLAEAQHNVCSQAVIQPSLGTLQPANEYSSANIHAPKTYKLINVWNIYWSMDQTGLSYLFTTTDYYQWRCFCSTGHLWPMGDFTLWLSFRWANSLSESSV